MPLAATHMPVVLDDRRNAIGVWMTVKGARPLRPIRVFVTYEALAQIEPSQPWGRHSALAGAHPPACAAFFGLGRRPRQAETGRFYRVTLKLT
jgi:hypothetical protein